MEGQYSEKVMEHFRNPRNMGDMPNPDGIGHVGNPVCGDIMELYIRVRDNVIEDAKFKTFGCLPADEEVVLSSGGWQGISEVKKGYSVVNSCGEPTYVIETFVRDYRGSIINIIPFASPFNSFSVTPEHPVFRIMKSRLDRIRRRNHRSGWLYIGEKELCRGQPEYIKAEDIKKRDYLIFTINKTIKDDSKFTKRLLRLIGYYLGVGYITAQGIAVTFLFKKNKKIESDELKSLIFSFINIPASERIKGNTREIYVCSERLADFLKRCAGSFAEDRSLSSKIMALPFTKQKELIDTYLVGEGNLCRKRADGSLTYRISTASSSLAIQFQEILARGGVFASVRKVSCSAHTIDDRMNRPSDTYFISFRLKQRNDFVRRAKGYFLVPVKKIKRIPFEGKVYNFQVAKEPNSYLVRGFAVHNCGAAIATSSMVTELVKGKTIEEALKISNRAVAEALGGLPKIKMHCSVLAEEALKSAIEDYLKKKANSEGEDK